MRVGEIVSRIGDAVEIRNFVNNVVVELTVNIMILLFTVVLMLIYSWKLTLILLVAIPVYGILFFAFNRLNRKIPAKDNGTECRFAGTACRIVRFNRHNKAFRYRGLHGM